VWVTVDNIKTVFDDGFATAADVCAGPIADLCTEAGIS
jgi:D-xylose transport system substrate-binding protein